MYCSVLPCGGDSLIDKVGGAIRWGGMWAG